MKKTATTRTGVPTPDPLKPAVRAAISDAYYHTRNVGGTMETAADLAATKVMAILTARPQEKRAVDGSKFITLPDGSLMRRPNPGAFDLQDTTSDKPRATAVEAGG